MAQLTPRDRQFALMQAHLTAARESLALAKTAYGHHPLSNFYLFSTLFEAADAQLAGIEGNLTCADGLRSSWEESHPNG